MFTCFDSLTLEILSKKRKKEKKGKKEKETD